MPHAHAMVAPRPEPAPAAPPSLAAKAVAAMAGAPLSCAATAVRDAIPDTPTSSARAAAPFLPGASLRRRAVEAAAAVVAAEAEATSPGAPLAARAAAAAARTPQPGASPNPSPSPDLDAVPDSAGPQAPPAEGQAHAPLQPTGLRAAAVASAAACKRKAESAPGGAGERLHRAKRGTSGDGGLAPSPMGPPSHEAPPLCDGQQVLARHSCFFCCST